MTPHALLALELAGYGLGALLIGLLIGRYAVPSARAVAAAPGDQLAGELNRMWEAGYDQGYQEGRHDGQDDAAERTAVHDVPLVPPGDRALPPDAPGLEARNDAESVLQLADDGDADGGEWEPAPTDLIARQARYHQPITATFRATTLADVKTWAARGETFLHDWHEEALADAAEFDRWMIGYAEHLEAVKSASWTDRLVREGM